VASEGHDISTMFWGRRVTEVSLPSLACWSSVFNWIHEKVALCPKFRFLEDLADCSFVKAKLVSNDAMCSAIVVVVERDNAGLQLPGEVTLPISVDVSLHKIAIGIAAVTIDNMVF